mmetsp:Transcript_26787/g.66667  ORF Transcript_26787/g.66667 Transcript_26787/m.66667 type:complete len:261 (-) Transcript_26787:2204-2986(-)
MRHRHSRRQPMLSTRHRPSPRPLTSRSPSHSARTPRWREPSHRPSRRSRESLLPAITGAPSHQPCSLMPTQRHRMPKSAQRGGRLVGMRFRRLSSHKRGTLGRLRWTRTSRVSHTVSTGTRRTTFRPSPLPPTSSGRTNTRGRQSPPLTAVGRQAPPAPGTIRRRQRAAIRPWQCQRCRLPCSAAPWAICGQEGWPPHEMSAWHWRPRFVGAGRGLLSRQSVDSSTHSRGLCRRHTRQTSLRTQSSGLRSWARDRRTPPG